MSNLMRNFEELTIDKAIVHILDKKKPRIVLSDGLLVLNESIYEDLLKTHIKKSINDDTAIAKFNAEEETCIVQEQCQMILETDDEDAFILASKIIANRLYSVMTRTTTSASFIVCKYVADNKRYVALLKMDFNDVIQAVETTEGGKTYIKLEAKDIAALPTTRQKLQKCMFYKSYEKDDEYDIILLDRQVDASEKEVADYFAQKFLQSNLCGTAKMNTIKFKTITDKFLTEHYHTNKEMINRKDLLISTIKNSEEIKIDNFADSIFAHDDVIKLMYKKKISDEMGHLVFDIDRDYAQKNYTKKKIETIDGITINMDFDLSTDPNKLDIIEKEDGRCDIIISGVKMKKAYIK